MPFERMVKRQYPPRQWALVGHPNAGKSTFAAQMAGPLLAIDADHRFSEVMNLAGAVYQLSDNSSDNVNPRRIHALLQEHMAGATIGTIVLDSLTSILAPAVTAAQLANAAGETTNKVAAFAEKALIVRMLQDSVTGWGCATLWIWHLRERRDEKAQKGVTPSISTVELARLRRSLNLELTIVEDGPRRGVKVTWARRGRSGDVLWDESGHWAGMPEKIERMVYDGLSQAEQDAIERKTPEGFSGPADAIAWGFAQDAFDDAVHAQAGYEKLKRREKPTTASAMWALWIADVRQRQAERLFPGKHPTTEPEPEF